MRKVFQEELKSVHDDLVEIARLVAAALEKAVESFKSADVDLAQEVIAEDARIDFRQTALDERAIDILALQGPVASDLRTIVGSLRMSASLERMGDLARHIAQLARLRYPESAIPVQLERTFARMAELDQQIITDLTTLLESHDLALVAKIQGANAEIDDLHAGVFRAIADASWTGSPALAVDAALASRYFERFADHGVSVSRKVSYLVTGEWDGDMTSN
ncbi:phosphate signaling complex protein PhoU [Sinomonas sp. JGH33]|uniref:Phosphate-specific transport system accessory protein PhoU n=1 Tax=Sinomonas terricola TaxID=3110330 RepID=A0ABU5TA59_9MICC|nr:phosphate signaling complex protein PhoU [Sinomonas sp. JGH33]MEA5456473.1 phosphate signaling complex protein PhoU [Sinomonas sp. JGH33]